MGLAYRLPELGERVGDYRIVEKLGSGSYGHVYKAELAGRFYAVKLLRGRLLHERARREIRILIHLDHPDVVRFFGCGYWPDPDIGHSYLVMEFAGGRTLETYAQEENPSAWRAARIILDTGLTLGEVFRQGVMHRDLKPDNIIIRDVSARPLLIDFGIGTLVGAPSVTSARLPPGTLEFRAPEAWRFARENVGASYDYSPADELWALGVNFYWLLTDVLPFGDREDEEGGGLAERILHQAPVAPHVLNPRCPQSLSDLCMRMLEKQPAARYGSVVEFCGALDAAMNGADTQWDVPLLEPDGPHTRTTEDDPARVDVNDPMRWANRWLKQRRHRGKRPPGQAPAPISRETSGIALKSVAEAPHVPAEPPARPEAPALAETPGTRLAPRHPASRPRAPLVAAAVLTVLLLCIRLSVGTHSAPGSVSPPSTLGGGAPAWKVESGREVVHSVMPSILSHGDGAGPGKGITPAPVTDAMHPKGISEKIYKKTKVTQRTGKVLGAVYLCSTLGGCMPQHVRPAPEPAPCPEGAAKAMEANLGVKMERMILIDMMLEDAPTQVITVHEGTFSAQLGPYRPGESSGIIFLSGTLIIGTERVYGRFTEARDLKKGGQPYPVCFEMWDKFKRTKGAILEKNDGPDSARIWSTEHVRAVSHFD